MENPAQPHLLFIINPIAGDIEKDQLEEEIISTCQAHRITYDIYKTSGQQDIDQVRQLMGKQSYDAVFAVGGDGTVSMAASILIGTSVPLGIIPLGSGNGLSKDLHIPQDTEEALKLIYRHEVRAIDTIDLNGRPSIHLSDLGFNALVVKRFSNGETRGPGAYAWIAMQEYLTYEPKFYRIDTDLETFEGNAFMVTVANANAFGSNASINPNGILNDGRFEICLIEPFPKTAGIGILYKLYTDSIDDSVYTRKLSCRKAIIYNIDHEVMHIDGEPVELGTEITVTMHPQSLRVVLPLPGDDEE
ncbi:NAD(+)/NADH kinase [Pontibacter sp. 172403-2]|uniref:diacylglycerol/lipid kinase family protein n=1 Tax=Pontibacter rufus TaxID=2791028 RepID=UPI0018AF81C2|nr:diacylglycerol kinase family protein [Pontibacter sp. 172403-2]MBF9254766.1 NAD(+)/NADH kinase [Pontibacter sp. 172403-2]